MVGRDHHREAGQWTALLIVSDNNWWETSSKANIRLLIDLLVGCEICCNIRARNPGRLDVHVSGIEPRSLSALFPASQDEQIMHRNIGQVLLLRSVMKPQALEPKPDFTDLQGIVQGSGVTVKID